MPSIVEHLQTLQQPQPELQGVIVPSRNFIPRYGNHFLPVFGNLEKLRLTRGDVFNAFARNHAIGCTTAIAWGFPRGGRPGGKSLEPALNAIPDFLSTLQTIRRDGLDANTYDEINALPNVKNGVTTKVLYFAGAFSITGAQALIYDSRVHNHILAEEWDEYQPLAKTLRRSTLMPTAEQYLMYLEITHSVACRVGWEPAAIELYMFTHSPGRRPPAHR